MTTPIVTREEFLQWIMEQPDEKSLSWRGTLSDATCKCPMAEYTTHMHYDAHEATRAALWRTITDLHGITVWMFEKGFDFDTFYDGSCANYGQLKASLKRKGLV